uniref:Metalloproteinase inhibitor 4 n=1 Tax=Periophthalmus magnuspinnatus TaxID=409849 RepID=A0A3B4AJM9_9GOBI
MKYVYTPVFSSLCGVKLDSNNKAGYLCALTGSMWSDGRISIGQCDLVESWDNLSLSQKKNLNYRYQMGCECRYIQMSGLMWSISVSAAVDTDLFFKQREELELLHFQLYLLWFVFVTGPEL